MTNNTPKWAEDIQKMYKQYPQAMMNWGADSWIDFIKNDVLHQARKEWDDILAETIDETSLEAQLNFWQKGSEYQKGLVKNLKAKGLLSTLKHE